MRADRLLSILMLLQSRQQMSAPALADELSVSVRTIYRDIDALCAAGIPIYADTGANGGYRLVENYRTNLTGLTQDEMNALLLVNIPETLVSLDEGQKLKTALLKLYAAQWTRPADHTPPPLYLDWAWWGQGHDTPPHLQTLYEAVRNYRRVTIRYRMMNGVEIERAVEPNGLVAKAGVWYVVYTGGGRLHHVRVSALIMVNALDETFVRDASFNLEGYWKAACADIERETGQFEVMLRIVPNVYRDLSLYFRSARWEVIADDGDWMRLNVWFDSFYAARTAILGLGGAVEVIEPEALRLSVADFAAQIIRRYTS